MLKLMSKYGSYGNLYDEVTMYYQPHLKFYVGDEIIVESNGNRYINTVVDTEHCQVYGWGELTENEKFIGFHRRASALKLGEVVGYGDLTVVDEED